MMRMMPLVLALAAAPGSLEAQGCGGAVRAPATGGWAEFVVTAPAARVASRVRYAVVGTERKGGQGHVRLETRVRGGNDAPEIVMQALVPGYPYAQAAIQEIVVRQGGNAPVRWGPALLARARTSERSALNRLIADGCAGGKLVGEEEVTVPAGTFRARHFRNAEAGSDIWVSEEVPFGLIKATGRDGASLELLGRGGDARSSISGEARTINGAE
jgi:hypothetical protein